MPNLPLKHKCLDPVLYIKTQIVYNRIQTLNSLFDNNFNVYY